jgi:hypothetical protein
MTQGDKLKSEVVPRAEECAEPGKENQEEPSQRDSLHDWFDGKMVWVQVAHSTSRPDFDDTQICVWHSWAMMRSSFEFLDAVHRCGYSLIAHQLMLIYM